MEADIKIIPSKVWLFVVLQWATTLVSLVLAWQRWPILPSAQGPSYAIAALAILLAVAITARWLFKSGWRRPLLPIELIAMTVAPVALVAASNWWQSPYVFLLLNSVVVAAYSIGFVTTMVLSVFASLVITIPYLFLGVESTGMTDQARIGDSLRWTALILFISVTSGYAVRISDRESEHKKQGFLRSEEIKKLEQANKLLFELHAVTQDLPVSLDEEDIVLSAFEQISSLVTYNSGYVLLRQDSLNGTPKTKESTWKIVTEKKNSRRVHTAPLLNLPEQVRVAILEKHFTTLTLSEKRYGFSKKAEVGLYYPIFLRGEVIGLVALERNSSKKFTSEDIEIVASLTTALAVALDNAKWFSRLRIMGADEERNRIARELHDSVGQTLTFLGLSADNLLKINENAGRPVEEIESFRLEVNEALSEMRNTLYDLRTNVTVTHDLPSLLKEYGKRVEKRSNVVVVVEANYKKRLPFLQEKEFWRIAQEAVANAEKYAKCEKITISWEYNDDKAILVVADNGKGFTPATARKDSYGLLGMNERAQAIGASLSITSTPKRGTVVRCELETHE